MSSRLPHGRQDRDRPEPRPLAGSSRPSRFFASSSTPEDVGSAKFRSERVRLHPVMRQVPRQHVHLHRQDRTNKYRRRVRLPPLRPVNDYFHYAPCTTTVDPRRFRGRQVPRRDPEHLRKRVQLPSPREQRLPLRRVRLLPTTTRERLPPLRPVNVYEMYHYCRPMNDYFPL
ncbi:hypothetical protein VPH35_055416 [Triticum aestivum]